MKRFFTLLLVLFTFSVFGQNLIPNPSVEEVVECPFSLGNIEVYTSHWQEFRGSPDYFNSCSTNQGLGWNNFAGYQEPRTGEGYLGLFTYHTGLTNARESIGITFENPLLIGETYYLSFFVSTCFSVSYVMISNRIGFLLMTDNYLNSAEQGILPNQSTFATTQMVSDTLNWVNISTSFVADSAYNYVAFGNFYNDEMTDTLRRDSSFGGAQAYYYFDDFCLSSNPNECDLSTSITRTIKYEEIELFPNPSTTVLNIKSEYKIIKAEIFNLTGQLQTADMTVENKSANVQFNLAQGIYIINLLTEKGVFKKRFVVQ